MSLVFFKTFFHFSVVKMMLIVLSGRQLNGTSFLVVGLTEKDWVILLDKLKDSVHNSVVSYTTSQMVLMMS